MVTLKEIKELVIALGKKWLFPDFTNKLTWFVVTVGGAILLTPTLVKLIFYNWLVETTNLNSGVHFTLAELANDSADYFLGVILIALALIHNIAYRYFNYLSSREEKRSHERRKKADTALFEKFKITLPSSSASVQLLKEHSFWNSYNIQAISQLEEFVNCWNNAEHSFLDASVESQKVELLSCCDSFLSKLAEVSGPVGAGPFYSSIPTMHKNDWNMPDFVTTKIDELNDKAMECYEKHQQFISLCKERLDC